MLLTATTQDAYSNLLANTALANALRMGGGNGGLGGNGIPGGGGGGGQLTNYAAFAPSQQYPPLMVGGPAGLGSWQTNAGAWAQYGLGGNAR